ncbi:response regulator [uncultured Fibrella sp.]|uniref:response regulator n=1 Tax=uncultured Fibrella sp. TaxID=1284596 RepID=UPI0035CBA32F
MSLRVLLVDDHRIILDSLSLLLASLDDVDVVGQLDDSRQVLPFLAENAVDVLLSDLNMPHLDGVQLTMQVRAQFPNLPVLLLTVTDQADVIRDAYRAGIAGYVLKRASRTELERAIQTVARGNRYFADAVLHELLLPVRPAVDNEPEPTLVKLTNREIDIIRLIAREQSTTQIAEQLFISVGTVETHRHNIMRKLGVRNMIGILKYALRYQLI